MKCQKCGTEFEGNFCPNCGEKVEVSETGGTVQNKENNTAVPASGGGKSGKNRILLVTAIVLGIVIVLLLIYIIHGRSGSHTKEDTSGSQKTQMQDDGTDKTDKTDEPAEKENESDGDSTAEFTEDWYKNQIYYKDDSGRMLEMGFLDTSDLVELFIDGTSCYSFAGSEYKEKDGTYIYEIEIGGATGELIYYPEDGSFDITISEESTRYYPVPEEEWQEEQPEVQTASGSYWLTDTVTGSDISSHIYFAHAYVTELNEVEVDVLCSVTNNTADVLTFDAASYFTLNNTGIIEYGYSDYDYTQIAAGATISTWVRFTYPRNANGDRNNMTMTVDGVDVYLSDKPQYDKDLEKLEGTYYAVNSSNGYLSDAAVYVIEELYDGSYQRIFYYKATADVSIDTFVLNDDNSFFISDSKYQWSPEDHSITYLTSQEGGKNSVYRKKW